MKIPNPRKEAGGGGKDTHIGHGINEGARDTMDNETSVDEIYNSIQSVPDKVSDEIKCREMGGSCGSRA